MDAVDRRLLDRLQAELPLVLRPFAALGDALGLGEGEVLARLAALQGEGVVRQLSAIFDTARLGYRSTLVAATVAPRRLEAAAAAINAHPGVSHDYERAFAWNLWFTLAVAPDSRLGLEGTVERLARAAGLERWRLLPARRVFKLGVRLDLEEGAGGGGVPGAPEGSGHAARPTPVVLDEADRALVRALQEPFPLVAEPYAVLADRSGLSVTRLLERARELRAAGVIRRVAALLHHRRAGYTANVLGVWAVPADRVEAAGRAAAEVRAVSHCYERPTYPDWPYALFTMVHGTSRDACLEALDAVAARTGATARVALWTVRELKKARLRYFTPEYAAWEGAA